MEKRNSNLSVKDLYVASFIWDDKVETKSWAQYDSAGEIKHNLIVSKSRVLVFKGKDEKGETHFYH